MTYLLCPVPEHATYRATRERLPRRVRIAHAVPTPTAVVTAPCHALRPVKPGRPPAIFPATLPVGTDTRLA
jgi:hypothetical protein